MGDHREHRGEHEVRRPGAGHGDREGNVPGKHTLTEGLLPAQVQLRAAGTPVMNGSVLRETAAAGVGGGGSKLPYLSLVQRSFGPEHDVSAIRAHVGGRAGDAAREIGAEAYATGNDVAFASSPDLHTAAHEAAHVIQQQAGVQLKGGVGEQGDTYEREADAVADAVVAGRSAAPLLAKYVGTSGGTSAVQMKKAAAPAVDEATLREVSGQLDTIVRKRESTAHSGRFALGLLHLEWAMLDDGPVTYSADSRLAFLGSATAMLRPVLSAMKADQRWLSWLHSAGIERGIATVRRQLNEQKVEDRLAAASLEESKEPTAAKSEGKRLESSIKLHLKTTAKLTSIANDLVEEAAPGALDSQHKKELLKAKGALGLDAINDTLGVVAAYLDLTDEEFEKRRSELAGLPGMTKAKTRVELYKGVAQLLESAVGATSKTARVIALQLGKTDLAANLDKIASSKVLGNIVGVVTIVHSATVLLDERSSDQEKLDAVFEGTSAALALAGATGAGFVLGTTYLVAKLAASLYWAARGSLTKAYTDAAFKTMSTESGLLVRRLETLVITGGLLAGEHDPDQQAALDKRQRGDASALGRQIDRFLDQSAQAVPERQAGGPSLASYPGNHRTLREIFQPLTTLKGKSEPAEALEAGTTLVETITGCFEDAHLIFGAELENGGVEKLEELRREENRKKYQQRVDEIRRKEELDEE